MLFLWHVCGKSKKQRTQFFNHFVFLWEFIQFSHVGSKGEVLEKIDRSIL